MRLSLCTCRLSMLNFYYHKQIIFLLFFVPMNKNKLSFLLGIRDINNSFIGCFYILVFRDSTSHFTNKNELY
ncbi:hypothetical protein BDF21DRAFT_419084 [Thamnidium elegans]|nr:hypothetical protein BDF21DRAFT_419084 [Thamnidium elegans]